MSRSQRPNPKGEQVGLETDLTVEKALHELKHIATALESIQMNFDKPNSSSYHWSDQLPILKQMKGLAKRVRDLSSVIYGSTAAFDSSLAFVNTISTGYEKHVMLYDHDVEHIATSMLAFVQNMLGQEPTEGKKGHLRTKLSDLKSQVDSLEKEKSYLQPALARLSKEVEALEIQVKLLTRENTRLKGHIAELQKREVAYLRILRRFEDGDSEYSIDKESRSLLLSSYQRQKKILLKNLTYYQEVKAKSGLNTAIDILNSIEDVEKEIERIDASIKGLEEDKEGN